MASPARRALSLVLVAALAVSMGCISSNRGAIRPRNLPMGPPVLAQRPPSPPRSVLVLSGGGMYGAYTAGVLAGMTASGSRPEFDIVTGVSTGALVATAAFLGPQYDNVARRSYTGIQKADIYNMRVWVTIPWSVSAASSEPLRKLIESVIDEQTVEAVAIEHARGRRLYVGTTCLATQRLAIWDMGAIAARGGPGAVEKFRHVLLASTAVPGVFPPVWLPAEYEGQIVEELHSDGGVTAPLFVPPGTLVPAHDGGPSGTDVYIIVSGKLFGEPRGVKSNVLSVLGSAASSAVYSYTRSEVASLYHQCRTSGANFHLTSLPLTINTPEPVGLSFNQQQMNQMYLAGVEFGRDPANWVRVPPFESAATDRPRE